MENCLINYNPKEHFEDVYTLLVTGGSDVVRSLFNEEDAEAIISLFEKGEFNEESLSNPVLKTEINDEFENNLEEVLQEENDNRLSSEANYYKLFGTNELTRWHNVLFNFRKSIMSSVIFDLKTKSPIVAEDRWFKVVNGRRVYNNFNKLNTELTLQKLKLMNDLGKAIDHKFGFDIDRALTGDFSEIIDTDTFTKEYIGLLLDFDTKSKFNTYDVNLKNIYFVLSEFDNLLKSEFSWIAVKDTIKVGEVVDVNMYEMFDPKVKHRRHFTSDDAMQAAIDRYTSHYMVRLLDFIPEVGEVVREENGITVVKEEDLNDTHIGFREFCHAISTVYDWALNDGQVDSDVRTEAELGNRGNVGKVIRAYLDSNSTKYTTNHKNKLRGLLKYIYAPDTYIETRNLFTNQVEKTVVTDWMVYSVEWNPETKQNELKYKKLTSFLVDKQHQSLQNAIRAAVLSFREDYDAFAEKFSDRIILHPDNTIELRGIAENDASVWFTKSETQGDKFLWNSNAFGKDGVTINDTKVEQLVADLLGLPITTDKQKRKDIFLQLNSRNLIDVFGQAICHTIAAIHDGKAIEYSGGKPTLVNYDTESTSAIKWNSLYEFERTGQWSLKLSSFLAQLDNGAVYLSRLFGSEQFNVMKDLHGNNVPYFQLGSYMHDIRKIIKTITDFGDKSPYIDNVILKQGVLGRTVLRGDIGNYTNLYKAKELPASDLVYLQATQDLYQHLQNGSTILVQPTCNADKTKFDLREIDLENISLGLGYSAKNAFDAITSNTERDFVNGAEPINEARATAVRLLETKIAEYRRSKTKGLLLEKYSRLCRILGISQEIGKTSTLAEVRVALANLNIALNNIVDPNGIQSCNEILEQRANKLGIAFFPTTDLTLGTNGWQINIALENDAELYWDEGISAKFEKRIKAQKLSFAKNLRKNRVFLNYKKDASLRRLVDNCFADPNKRAQWVDPINGNIKTHRIFKNGVEVYIPENRLGDYNLTSEYTVELNPIFEAFFYSQAWFAQSITDILYSDDALFDTKASVSKIDPKVVKQILREDGWMIDDLSKYKKALEPIITTKKDITLTEEERAIKLNEIVLGLQKHDIVRDLFHAEELIERISNAEKEAFVRMDEASRLSAMFKRTMLGGSTRHNLQPQTFGSDEFVTVACSKDMRAPVSDILGTVANEYAQDGAGFSSPVQTILENWSYLDAALGKSRKTIWGYVDPETGQMHEIKWAVFTLTNEVRQNSLMNGDYSYEVAYQKMHDIPLNVSVKLEKFWNKNTTSYSSHRGWNKKKITSNNDICRFDYDTGSYYRLTNAWTDEYGTGHTTWERVILKNGNLIAVQTPESEREIKRSLDSLYDIDQLFGGAFAYEWDNEIGDFVQTDAVSSIMANIVCEYNAKDKFVGYLIPQQAMKVSVRNRNNNELFTPWNKDPLSTFRISLVHGGAQMDAEHEVENGDVAEMMQAVAALGQNGYLTEETLDVYEIIGETIRSSIPEIRNAVKQVAVIEDNGENTKEAESRIDSLLGKLLIDAFNKDNSQDKLGLAGAFVRRAEQMLNANSSVNIEIPLSASSIKGKFMSEVATKVNKAIRRRCPGLGTVQAPGYKTMSHCSFNGEPMTFKRLSQVLNEPVINAFGKKQPSIIAQFDEIVKDIDNLSDKSKADYLKYKKKVDNLLRNQLIDKSGRIRNPLIKPLLEIGRKQLTIEDTVVVRRKGSVSEGKVIQIKDARELDMFQNIIDLNEFEIYKWDGKPRELRAALTEIELVHHDRLKEDGISTTKLSIQQLDVNRALFYIHEFTDEDSGKVRDFRYESFMDGLSAKSFYEIERQKKLNLIKKVISDYDELQAYRDKSDDEIYENLPAIRLILTGLSQQINAGLSDVYRKKGDFVIPQRDAMLSGSVVDRNTVATFAVKTVSTKPPQIILGRAYATLLGIKSTDNVWDITGPEYFKKNIKALEELPPKSLVPENTYDCMLLTEDGRKVLVSIGNDLDKDDVINQPNVKSGNRAFSKQLGILTLNGEDVCEIDGIGIYTYVTENGSTYDLIKVDNADIFTTLLNSGFFVTTKYNYTVDNYLDLLEIQGLLKDEYLDKFEVDDLLTSAEYVSEKYDLDEIRKILLLQPDSAVNSLIKLEKRNSEKRIGKLAQKRWEAYQETMRFIGARIPTQSQQSFSSAEIVMFADVETNECWLPRVVTWIEGSDYKSIL